MTSPHNAYPPDDLKQRYLDASAAQGIGPNDRVRHAALAHAQIVAASRAPESAAVASQKPSANRWNFALVASVAIAGISTLLALQFDRSDPEEKAVLLAKEQGGDATARAASASASSSAAVERAQAALPVPGAPAVLAAPSFNPDSELTAKRAPARPTLPSAQTLSKSRASPLADASPGAQPDTQKDAARSGLPAAAMKSYSTAPPNAVTNATPPASPAVATSAALRNAARTGQTTLLEQALQQATVAQINTPDDKGRTALMLATLGGHIGSVQRLLTAGADPGLKDLEGKTALQMAQQAGFTVIDNILTKQPVAQ
jgi:Ankyrin repeats (many copies)